MLGITDPLAPIMPDARDQAWLHEEMSNRDIETLGSASLRRRLGVILSETGEIDTNEAKAIRQELKRRIGHV
jgi:hypothetical protein